MTLNEFLQNRQHINITTGSPGVHEHKSEQPKLTESGESFAEILGKHKGVQFSGHAMRRLESRSIDIVADAKLERLNRGVELAASKGSSDALVLVDSTAFVVSVKNNKVITTMSGADLAGSVFTNIDSTIII
jgi:flagellar operon protein